MAIFSIFHLWAFPWQVYDIRRSEIVASESAPGFLPDPKTAYSGGRFGTRALMDAFNPWDLVKNIGRGFRWFVVGRRKRMDDISYKNSAYTPGLEPTRNQLTAFDNVGNNSLDAGPPSYIGGGKSNRYQPVGDDDDADRLLAHAQTNPRDPSPHPPYPRPMERLPDRNAPAASGDIGTMGVYDPPPPSKSTAQQPHNNKYNNNLPYSTNSTPQESGIIDPSSTGSFDTSYHGAANASASGSGHRRTVTPTTVPPDPHPLGPPGRSSNEIEEWDLWSGGRESERDLGGGHGVGDNRF